MCGVTGEEGTSVAPTRRDPGLERVDDVTLEPGVSGVDVPGCEEFPRARRLVEFVDRLVREPHELPAATTGPARDRRGRTGRITDLLVHGVEDPRFVEDHVDDEPVVVEATVVDIDVEEVADGRVGAVAPDDVRRRERLGIRVVRGQPFARVTDHAHVLDGHVAVVLRDRLHPASASDVERRERTRTLLEDRLELGLAEHRRERPTGRRDANATEPEQRVTARVAPLVDLGRLGDRAHVVADATRLDDATDLVVEVHGSRQQVGVGPLLEDRHGPSPLREQDSQHQADGPGADDRDVGLRGSAHTWRSGWWPQALIES